uniref:uncharacterized protein LOC100180694 n=1 Tax=Ciona intestinalis TaxID=7719 RepID=UPI000180CB56|nr:uncharacterized protein LOC100180694 [Ciona intestinalis]|eukprot:XP_002127016.1 uncharacterized protein LOC100180694 [Ciona intestinalis]
MAKTAHEEMEQMDTDDQDEKEFLQSVLISLPGVNPRSEVIQRALQEIADPLLGENSLQNEKNNVSSEEEMEDDAVIDPDYIQSVLETLPGVNPRNEMVQEAIKVFAEDQIRESSMQSSSLNKANDNVNDPEYLQSVLETLPGVNPHSDVVQAVVREVSSVGNNEKHKDQEEDGN